MNNGRQCSHVGFWLTIVFLAAFLGLSLVLNAGLAAGLFVRDAVRGAATLGAAEDEYPQFEETLSFGDGDAKVVRIAVEGIIQRSTQQGWFGIPVDPIGDVLRQIRAARNDAEVRALIVEIDSPGGEVPPTDEIYRALRDFRESRDDRRVLVFVRGLAASGGYYIAAAADHIVTEPTALLGSISVIMQTLNWHVLSDRVGVTDTTIRSGRHKDLLNPFRPVDPEGVAVLQRVVDDIHARFAKLVGEGRGLDAAAVAAVADGRVFTAADALEKDLVDEIGYWEHAVARTSELLDESVYVIRYTRTQRFSDWLARIRAPVDLTALTPPRGARPMFLWQP